MATQGLVSVVDDAGKTLVKIVTGCDGYAAPLLAERITKENLTHLQEIYQAALACGFGGADSLVVMDKQDFICANGDDELPELYWQTFDNPRFNPRWARGIAEFVEIVHLASNQ